MAYSLSRRASPKAISLIGLIALLFFIPFLLLAVYQAVVLVSRATGTRANIMVEANSSVGLVRTDFYHAFAQGGEEANDMLEPVAAQVRELKPKTIRLDHVYDHYNVVNNQAGLSFDFSRLDRAVDTILASGAKPLLSLSYMPPVIAKDGKITGPPNNWQDWALVVQKTIEHYSGKNQKNIGGVYYEVWNEPDLPQFGKWGLTGETNYLTLYHWAAVGATNANGVNPFYLGGPATSGLNRNWIEALVTSGDRLDFISWHSYLPNPKQYDDNQRNLVAWLLPHPDYILIPKLITEFGFSGEKDSRWGEPYAAAYTAAVVRQLISGGPTYLFSFQLKDGPNQTNDGWGLITHETSGGKLKPRYYLYSFLDAMSGNRLNLTGEGTWVTGFASQKNNTVRVLLVNFDQTGNHTEMVPITFSNLLPGAYTYRERLLLGRDVTFNETVTNANPSLTKTVFLPAQSVVRLELTKH